MAKMWLKYGLNVAGIWLKYGLNMTEIQLEYGWNMARIWPQKLIKLSIVNVYHL